MGKRHVINYHMNKNVLFNKKTFINIYKNN